MTQRLAPAGLAALLGAVLLGGCASMDQDQERYLNYAAWRQMDEAPQPRLEQVPTRHVVHFPTGVDIMTATDRVTLASFLATNNVGRGAQVALSVVNPTAEAVARQASRLETVASTLNRMGIATVAQPPTIDAGPDIIGAQSDDVVVTAYKLAVLPPACPGYNTPVQLDETGRPITVFGCANAANLGLMVADPTDLEEGRTLAPADGEAAALGIKRYRQGVVTPLKIEGTS